MTGSKSLLQLVVQFVCDDPVKAAHHIEGMDAELGLEILDALSPREFAKVVDHLDPHYMSGLVLDGAPEKVVPVLEKGGSQACATVLLALPHEARQRFLDSVSADTRDQIQEILTFPADSAGRAMKTDYTAFHVEMTANEAIGRLRARAGVHRSPSNIFVVDDANALAGVISMRDLVIAPSDAVLSALMQTDVLKVGPFEELSKTLQVLSGRGFTTLPVVDSQNQMLGVVRATQLLEGARESAAQDIQRLFGAGKDERTFSPMAFSLRKRLPWLHINLATAFLAASVVALFEDVIARITILAVYLPVVAGQGGNAGAQSLAVVMRGLVMREIPQQQIRKMLVKEGLIGVINGLVVGLVTALVAWAWDGNPYLGLVIGLAMVVNLTVAGLAGAGIPIAMRRLGLDPAQSSSIVLTTVTDVVGFFAFLGFAVLMQDLLV